MLVTLDLPEPLAYRLRCLATEDGTTVEALIVTILQGQPGKGSHGRTRQLSLEAVPERIAATLDGCRYLTRARWPELGDGKWWHAELRAWGLVDIPSTIRALDAWCGANPTKAPKSRVKAFFHRNLSRKQREAEEASRQ